MELDDIIQESIGLMEKEFYKNKFYFSYSSMSKLMWSPAAFYQIYVLGNREERTESHLVNGKIIHALLLEEQKFNDNFIVSPSNLPTGNSRTVVDRVYAHYKELVSNGDVRTDLSQFEDAVIDVLKDMNLHQALKTDQQRIDKIVTPENTNYWEFLKNKGNKTLIDQENYEFCKNAVDILKLDSNLCKLIGCNTTDFDNREVLNEEFLQCEVTNLPFGLKGIVDNIVLDHDNKMIYINDIKTTSKELKEFSETIEFYGYWMQAAIYMTMVAVKYMNLIDAGYNVKFHFVVIDKMFQCYPFRVSEATMQGWFNRLSDTLEKAEWHYTNKDYTLPYEFAKGQVVL